jgi:pectate lyase-like protein
MTARIATLAAFVVTLAPAADLRTEAIETLRKAATFYRQQVSTEGGYHFNYAADLSYGRSESAEGPTQVSVQREGTPSVGMAYLDAWEATGDRLYLDAATDAARALVRGQLCSGGWTYIIEFDPAKRGRHAYRADNNCGGSGNVTVLDDNVTQAAVRLLMRVDRELEFKDAPIHEAASYALEKLITAQYPIGAWPQRFTAPPDPAKYPVKKASYPDSWEREWPGADYRNHYTFNDNTISDVIDMFLEAARIYDEPKYLAVAERGGDFILLAQMPDPQPAWAQQYDVDMHPAWARLFEPPSVTGGESKGIMQTLFVLYRETGDRKYLEPVPRALKYLQDSVVPESNSEIYRRAARGGGPVLARFYELKTNRPLYITKGMQVRVRGQSSARPEGYEVSYSDESVITHYGVLTNGRELAGIDAQYRSLAAADPASLRRPSKLHGLSPWQDPGQLLVTDAAIQAIVDSIDKRGAWVQQGYIGKADRVVSVFAAGNMTVRIGERTYPLKENETVEVFAGSLPPREEVIRSPTFVRNVRALARFVQ